MDAMMRVADPDAHGLPWLSALRPQLAVLQNCAPAERARCDHAVSLPMLFSSNRTGLQTSPGAQLGSATAAA